MELSLYDVENCLYADHDGLCAICHQPETRRGRRALSLDHDHATDAIRGLLCHRCNVGLGNFKDNPEALRAAAAYLERTPPYWPAVDQPATRNGLHELYVTDDPRLKRV